MESLPYYRRGFTLIELLVVLAIITIITGLVFTSQSSFNKTLILANTAYDVALSLRSAETYGINSRAVGGIVSVGYGVDFQKVSPSTFTLFADTYPAPSTSSTSCHPTTDPTMPDAVYGNCVYNASTGQDQLIKQYTLGNGVTVSDFCVHQSTGWACANSNGSTLAQLDIVFARPNPQPFISVNGAYDSANPIDTACIALTSPQGGGRYITVSASGEITANASSCP